MALRAANDVDASFVPVPAQNLAAVELDGEIVLYHEDQDTLHVLNQTAAVVWASFDGRSSIRDIAADLGEIFEVSADVIESDVLVLLSQLGREGLLSGVEPDPEAVASRRMPAGAVPVDESDCD